MKVKGLFVILCSLSFILFFSCTKINESTQLGDDLIPAVDNVNTFDTTLEVDAAYFPFNDTTRATGFDNLALGRLNDPEFGMTTADMYFNFSSPVYGTYPFSNRDSIKGIDSVVLSLAYQTGYGDTTTGQLTVQVSEIRDPDELKLDSVYAFTFPGFSPGPVLAANKTFTIQNIRDSVPVLRKGDTTKSGNALRIRFDNNSLATKFISFDTIATSGNRGYFSDSAFRALFRGLAVKTTNASGVGTLAYFNLTNANSKLIVYYRVGRSTGIDSGASVIFSPFRSLASDNGVANSISRNISGSTYALNLAKPSSDKLYLQSSPLGSYIGINVPGLTSFPNKVIHRAELIAYTVPSSPADDKLTEPNLLFLTHKGPSKDSLYFFERDLVASVDGSSLDFVSFGGLLRTDDSYRFNITRYVQGIVTRKERNDSLILYSPYVARIFSGVAKQSLGILDYVARGRAIIANNNFADRNKRLRLRIIYSNL